MASQIEMRDVVRRFGSAYVAGSDAAMLPSQEKALADIAACHTAEMGGHRYNCQDCDKNFWVCHACRNRGKSKICLSSPQGCHRSCPACGGRRTREWVSARQFELLGCRYYHGKSKICLSSPLGCHHVVATVPQSLRAAFLANQKGLYGLFMKTVAQCVMDLASDSRFVGGLPAVLAVLHTWASDLGYHPHVHLLVSAGGLSADAEHWTEPRHVKWLVPVQALSALIRGRFLNRLRRVAPEVFSSLPQGVAHEGWNVFCKPCAVDASAVVSYLGRYIFRTAISNSRIEAMDETHVTFRFRSRRKGRPWSRIRLRGEEFLRRYVMHVLPRGFQKVRYYGLWHHSKSDERRRIQTLFALEAASGQSSCPAPQPLSLALACAGKALGTAGGPAEDGGAPALACPDCGGTSLRCIEWVPRRNRSP